MPDVTDSVETPCERHLLDRSRGMISQGAAEIVKPHT
jgi:hypothetical protein